MTCQIHGWWFGTPCPKCPGEINGPDRSHSPNVGGVSVVSSPIGSYVEPPLPAEAGDDWEIPAYLLRRADGGFMYPSLHGDKRAAQLSDDDRPASSNRRGMELGNSTALKFWPDDKLLTALSDHTISVIDRQPILEEAKKRHDQVKGYERQRPFLHGVPNVYS